MGMVYIQMYNSLSVYLRDNHGIEPQGYGLLLTSSAHHGHRLSDLDDARHQDAAAVSDDGAGYRVLSDWIRYVRRRVGVLAVRAGGGHHHRRRDDRHADEPDAGGGLCADGHARALHGGVRIVGERAGRGGPLAAGIVLDNYQSESALVSLSRSLCAISASEFLRAAPAGWGASRDSRPRRREPIARRWRWRPSMGDIEISPIAHVIQLSVAPVFLLSGIGAILAVMTNRLGRIIDRARVLEAHARRRRRRHRTRPCSKRIWPR